MRIVACILCLIGCVTQSFAQDFEFEHREILGMLERDECPLAKHPYWTIGDITGRMGQRDTLRTKEQFESACSCEFDEVKRLVEAIECPRFEGLPIPGDYVRRGLDPTKDDVEEGSQVREENLAKKNERWKLYKPAYDKCPVLRTKYVGPLICRPKGKQIS